VASRVFSFHTMSLDAIISNSQFKHGRTGFQPVCLHDDRLEACRTYFSIDPWDQSPDELKILHNFDPQERESASVSEIRSDGPSLILTPLRATITLAANFPIARCFADQLWNSQKPKRLRRCL